MNSNNKYKVYSDILKSNRSDLKALLKNFKNFNNNSSHSRNLNEFKAWSLIENLLEMNDVTDEHFDHDGDSLLNGSDSRNYYNSPLTVTQPLIYSNEELLKLYVSLFI